MATFTEALMGQKKKAQLAGRPGIGAIGGDGIGAAPTLDLTAGRERIEARQAVETRQRVEAEQARLETERLAEQKRQEEARIAEQKRQEELMVQQREREAAQAAAAAKTPTKRFLGVKK